MNPDLSVRGSTTGLPSIPYSIGLDRTEVLFSDYNTHQVIYASFTFYRIKLNVSVNPILYPSPVPRIPHFLSLLLHRLLLTFFLVGLPSLLATPRPRLVQRRRFSVVWRHFRCVNKRGTVGDWANYRNYRVRLLAARENKLNVLRRRKRIVRRGGRWHEEGKRREGNYSDSSLFVSNLFN